MALGMDVGLGPGHIVLDGDPALSSKRGHSPQLFAHVYFAKRLKAVCIRIPLGTEVSLSLREIVSRM